MTQRDRNRPDANNVRHIVIMLRSHTRVVALAAAAGAVTLVAAAPASAAGGWTPLPNYWSTSATAIQVNDIWAVGNRSWTVGTEDTPGGRRAVVQDCTGSVCTRIRLPDPAGFLPGTTLVSSISGSSATDIWAVGGAFDDAQESVSWHWDGTSWSVAGNTVGNALINNVTTVLPAESYAVADYDYGDGGTSVILHRTGTSWTNLTPAVTSYLPGTCAEWYYNDFRDIAVVGGFPVVVGSCDGVPVILKQSGPTTWRRIDAGLPAGSTFTQAATIGSQLWVQGTSATGSVIVYRRDSGVWVDVPVTGIAAGAVVTDLAGSSTGSVWMVGSQAGQATGWRLAGTRWTAVPLPASVSAAAVTALWVTGPGSAYAAGRDVTKAVPKQGVIVRAG